MPEAIRDEPVGNRILELQIAEVVAETDDARSLVFAVPDGPGDPEVSPEWLKYAPGQFLTLRVPSERTGSVARNYSLSSSPFTDDAMTVTVKRTVNGYASNWLNDHADKGMRIQVLAPAGTFVPQSFDGDFLLLAAGSGITPIMSICKSVLSEGGGQVTLVYANRDEHSVIFADALRVLAAKYADRLTVLHWLESLKGRPTVTALATLAAPYSNRPAFICGPGPFMDAARQALDELKVPARQIHIEVFKSLNSDPFAETTATVAEQTIETLATAIVQLDGETHTVPWPRNVKLLDVLLAEGIDVPFLCREGWCGTCACTLRKGKVHMEVHDALDQEALDGGRILACQSHPETDSVEVTYDE